MNGILRNRPALDRIIAATCAETGVSVASVLDRTRESEVVEVRHIAMYLARTMTAYSESEISRHFQRHAGGTIYAFNQITERIGKSAELNKTIAAIESRLKGTT